MAIRAVSGKPGAGKSLFLVSRVIEPAVKADRTVYVYGLDGLTLPHERLEGDFLLPTRSGHYLPDLDRLRELEGGSIVIFDEAHMVFGAGSGKEMGADLREWFARHRHYTDRAGRSMEIWVAVQDAMQLTAQFRALVAEFYHFKRGTLLGIKGMSFMNVWDGPPGAPGAVRTGTRIVIDNRRCYKFYASTEVATSAATEASMFSGGKLKAWGGVAFIAAVGYGFWSLIPWTDDGDVGRPGEFRPVEPVEVPNAYETLLPSPIDYAGESGRYLTITIDPGVIPEHGRYPWIRNRTLGN